MHDFEFQNSTRIIFGRGRSMEIGQLTYPVADTVVLVTGTASAQKTGLLQKITACLEKAGVKVELLEGIRSNPALSKVYEGIELVRKHDTGAVVALGGGSVMDTAKAIAAGSVVGHDVWDFFEGSKEIGNALPVITVPTLAASGSEMNGFMVITSEDRGLKLAAGSEALYPRFSILDPELTFSVPADYTAYGAVDAVCHILESYFNGPAKQTPVTDRIAEGLILSITETAGLCIAEPENYECRAALMWAATLALCGLCKTGTGEHCFPVHLLEHAVSAFFPVAHGAGLSALLPGWMKWHAESGGNSKIVQFGTRVLNAEADADSVITAFSQWLASIDAPVSLSEIGVRQNDVAKLTEHALHQARIWGVDKIYTANMIESIYLKCF